MSACCIFFICCSLGDGLVIYLWCTCGLLMDLWIYLDELEHLLLYMWYILWWMCGWMRYICDGWDIYVTNEIYMWWMRYMIVWIYLSWWNVKKIKNFRFGSLCRVLHSAKDPVAKCHGHSTRQRIFFYILCGGSRLRNGEKKDRNTESDKVFTSWKEQFRLAYVHDCCTGCGIHLLKNYHLRSLC